MRRALVQAQALTNVDQTQLRTLQVEAKEHIDGLLDRPWPRRCPGGGGDGSFAYRNPLSQCGTTITLLRGGSQAICAGWVLGGVGTQTLMVRGVIASVRTGRALEYQVQSF